MREALTRLAEQGLVVALPQQGFRVRPLTLTDLDELTDARVEIETMVLRRSIERGDIAWESSVVAGHHQLATPRLPAPRAISTGSGSARMRSCTPAPCAAAETTGSTGVAVALRDAASLYRWWSRPVGHDYDRDVELEHRQILDAIVGRDADAAGDLLTRHIQRPSDALRIAATEETDLAANGTSPI